MRTSGSRSSTCPQIALVGDGGHEAFGMRVVFPQGYLEVGHEVCGMPVVRSQCYFHSIAQVASGSLGF